MPELRRDVTQRDIAGEELASVGISQILETPAADVCALQDVLPLSPAKLVRVVCQNSADRLSGPLFVVVEDAAQPFMADDGGIHVDHAR